MLCPRSMRTRPWSTFSASKHLFSKNLRQNSSDEDDEFTFCCTAFLWKSGFTVCTVRCMSFLIGCYRSPSRKLSGLTSAWMTRMLCSCSTMLRMQMVKYMTRGCGITLSLRVLKMFTAFWERSHGFRTQQTMRSCLCTYVTASLMRTYQQSAVVVELAYQHASVVEEVGGANAAVKVTDAGLQPSVQLSVDVKLPDVGWPLNLQWWLYRHLVRLTHFQPLAAEHLNTNPVALIMKLHCSDTDDRT